MSTATVTVNCGTVVALSVSRSAMMRRIRLIWCGGPVFGVPVVGRRSRGHGTRCGRCERAAAAGAAEAASRAARNVLARDAAFRPGARDGARVDAGIAREPAGPRTDAKAAVAGVSGTAAAATATAATAAAAGSGATGDFATEGGSDRRCPNRLRVGVTASPGSPTYPQTAFTGTVWPSSTTRFRSTPFSKASTSMFDLSVSISKSTSPFSTLSPTRCARRRGRTSSVIWPGFGMRSDEPLVSLAESAGVPGLQ